MQLIMQNGVYNPNPNSDFENQIADKYFLIKLATKIEKNKIIKIMASEYRQTMNLRLMPTAQLVLLIDQSNNDPNYWLDGF